MTPSPDFPYGRVTLAIALSIVAHSMLLWQLPQIALPVNEKTLPPLQAKLEPLPKLAKKSPVRKHKMQSFSQPAPFAAPVIAAIPALPDSAASSVVTASAALPDRAEPLLPTTPPADEADNRPLLPRHAQLHFAVQYASGNFKVGEVIHFLDNIDGRYTLRATTQTTGLVGLFKSYHLTQTSTGKVSKLGLQPESYEEVKKDSSGTQTAIANFDWDAHKVRFNDGKEMPLSEQAQDVLSLPYQLSQLPLNKESIQVALSNGKNISQYYIAVGDEATISTVMGELRTIALHKVHGANEDGLIIWLALEYRLLPVKILYLDKSGEVSANMVITDIRVSDE